MEGAEEGPVEQLRSWWLLKRWLPLGMLLLCLWTALKLVDFLWWRPKRLEEHFAKQGIRGPKYKFLLGNMKEMVASMNAAGAPNKPLMQRHCNSHNIVPRVLAFYPLWKKIYGSVFTLWFGPTARVMVADPELIREILVSNSQAYDKYQSHPLVRQLEGEGLLSLTGEKWARHRKLISPTFHIENLKLLIPFIGKSVVDRVTTWLPVAATGGDEVEVDVAELFQSTTEDAITRTAFGKSYEDGKAVFQLQARQMLLAAESFRNICIPGCRFLPTQKNLHSWRLDREINRSLRKLIDDRKEKHSPEHGHDQQREKKVAERDRARDLLGLLIDASVKEEEDDDKITVHDIVEECKTFFFAGKHTTTNLLTWATVLLAMHPEWQDRAREEVLKVCGPRDVPTRDNVSKLRTLGMILNETLRLYPPVVATIRRAKSDVHLGGGKYRIPRGTELLIPIVAVHHDSALWGPDVHDFNPNRFSNGVAQAARHPTAFIPFGLGPRTCVGQNLALLESKLTLAILLQRFSLRLSPSYVHAPTVPMLLYPQYGAPIIFRPVRPDLDRRLSSPTVPDDVPCSR